MPTTIPAIILETVLARIAGLFLSGAGGDLTIARQAAAQMLAAYHPETAEELRLAAQIVSFSFHALEALSQATAADVPLTRILRLRGSAVSLNRESEKAQRRLDQCQQARREAVSAQTLPEAKIETPTPNSRPVPTTQPPSSATWNREEDEIRIAASLKRAEARVAALANTTPLGTNPTQPDHAS